MKRTIMFTALLACLTSLPTDVKAQKNNEKETEFKYVIRYQDGRN